MRREAAKRHANGYLDRMRREYTREESLAEFRRMFEEQWGLKAMLATMPPGSTMEDALRLHRRLKQMDRQPCSFLDEELGIHRDR